MHRFRELVRASLEEDIGRGDLTTTSMVPTNARCKVHLLAKESGIASGMGIFKMVFEHLEANVTDWRAIEDASPFEEGDDLARTDWRLARDLVLIRIVEQLHQLGWLDQNSDVIPENVEAAEETVAA